MRLGLATGLLGLTLIVGCGGGDGSSDGANDPNSGGAGTGTASDRAHVDLSGHYELSSRFDLTTAGVFPDGANVTFQALSKLSDDPAATVLDLLQAAGVPIVSTVLKWLPGTLKTPFENWFNDFVNKSIYQGMPATKQMASLVDDLATVITQFEVVSTLDVPAPDAQGNAQATHTFTGVAFNVMGARSVVQAPAQVSSESRATNVAVNAVHILEAAPEVEDGRMELGNHSFSVPYGKYVMSAVDLMAQKRLGAATLRDALGKMVDCAALAKDLAGRCVGPVCVGHEADVKELCTAGLDAVANQVATTVAGLKFDVVHFTTGDARLWDAPMPNGVLDGKIDRIDGGGWVVGLNVGQGEHPVAASFTGKRLGDFVAP